MHFYAKHKISSLNRNLDQLQRKAGEIWVTVKEPFCKCNSGIKRMDRSGFHIYIRALFQNSMGYVCAA